MSTVATSRIPKLAGFTWKNNSENSRYKLEVTQMKTEKMLYSRTEACEVLGVGSVTLWRLVQRGELKPRYVGDRPMFSRTELARFAGIGR